MSVGHPRYKFRVLVNMSIYGTVWNKCCFRCKIGNIFLRELAYLVGWTFLNGGSSLVWRNIQQNYFIGYLLNTCSFSSSWTCKDEQEGVWGEKCWKHPTQFYIINVLAQCLFSCIWKLVQCGHSLSRACLVSWKSVYLDLSWPVFDLAGPVWLEICLLFGGHKKTLEILDQVWLLGPPKCSLETPVLVPQSNQLPGAKDSSGGARAHKLSFWGLTRCIQGALARTPRLSVHYGSLA